VLLNAVAAGSSCAKPMVAAVAKISVAVERVSFMKTDYVVARNREI
jgi:hypothetical protein